MHLYGQRKGREVLIMILTYAIQLFRPTPEPSIVTALPALSADMPVFWMRPTRHRFIESLSARAVRDARLVVNTRRYLGRHGMTAALLNRTGAFCGSRAMAMPRLL